MSSLSSGYIKSSITKLDQFILCSLSWIYLSYFEPRSYQNHNCTNIGIKQTCKLSDAYMTFKYRLKKRKPSYKATQKRIRFLYINRKILLTHRTFLHRFCHYLCGCGIEFDKEILQGRAFQQRDALSQRTNNSGKINKAYLPKPIITY